MQTRHSATSDSKKCFHSGKGLHNGGLFCYHSGMYTPDYDEYYSLKSYADRFVSDSDEVIKVYFSRPSTLNLITLWEMKNGNEMFISALMENYHERAMDGEEFDVDELISTMNLLSVFNEKGDIRAHIDIYNDFVAYLTENGINI